MNINFCRNWVKTPVYVSSFTGLTMFIASLLNQSFLSNVSLSIYTLCAKETSTYRRLCLHDAKNDAMWRTKCCPRICIAFREIPSEGFPLRGFSKKCAKTNCLSCFAWKLRRLFGLDSSSRNFTSRKHHTREHLFSLYFGIILASNLTKVLFPSNIILGHFMKEMRVYYYFFARTLYCART